MAIMAVFPWIELVLYSSIQKVKQWKDSGLPCCPKKREPLYDGEYDEEEEEEEEKKEKKPKDAFDEDYSGGEDEEENEEEYDDEDEMYTDDEIARFTQATTKKDYIAIYAGLEYLIHFKYSSVLVQVYVAFMYGMFVPLLFPMAAFGIMNMYITEKIALTYFYRQPPMYDETLNQKAFDILKNAPLFMFILGYWAIGNPAIFEGQAEVRVFFNRSADPKHMGIEFCMINQSHFAFLIFLMWFVREFLYDMIYVRCILRCKEYCCGATKDGADISDEQLDENLPNFFNAIAGDFQKVWYATELYNQKHNGIKSLDNDQMELLRTAKGYMASKKICSLPTYDILSNWYYQDMFMYDPLVEREFAFDEDENYKLPFNEEGECYMNWDASDIIVRLLNIDDNRVRPKKYSLQDEKDQLELRGKGLAILSKMAADKKKTEEAKGKIDKLFKGFAQNKKKEIKNAAGGFAAILNNK